MANSVRIMINEEQLQKLLEGKVVKFTNQFAETVAEVAVSDIGSDRIINIAIKAKENLQL